MHLEFYNYKDLSSFFDKFPNGLPERIINIMFYQISLSLVELHKHNIIHRDIKPSNIFVNILGGHVVIISVVILEYL